MLGRQESSGQTALALITLSASNSLAETCSESVRHMLFPGSGVQRCKATSSAAWPHASYLGLQVLSAGSNAEQAKASRAAKGRY